jgi:tetratricopeptide (TPR) repeat protein
MTDGGARDDVPALAGRGAADEELHARLSAGRAVIVTGEQVSAALSGGHRCSTWKGVVESAIEWCGNHLEDLAPEWADRASSMLQWGLTDEPAARLLAADTVTDRLGGRDGIDYGAWLHHSLGELPLVDGAIVQAIHGLRAPVICTTYDDLIERALGWSGGPVTARDAFRVHRALTSHDRAVVHLYGRFDDPGSVLLGVRPDDAAFGPATSEVLRRAFVEGHTAVFLGLTADPNLAALRRWLLSGVTGTVGQHFWLCMNDEYATALDISRDSTMTPLPYGRDIQDLLAQLQHLAAEHRDSVTLQPGEPGDGKLESSPFVGRDELMKELEETLSPPFDGPRVVALRGLIGVGKTRAAREYVFRHQDDYHIVCWIPAERKSAAEQALADLTGPLGLPNVVDTAQQISAVKARLETVGRWLLVFDNVENFRAISELFPTSGHGHILLTARLAVRDLDNSVTAITVKPLNPPDAARLMTSGAPAIPTDVDSDIARLCRELDYLPLALVSARDSLSRGVSARRFLLEVQQRRPDRGDEIKNAFAVAVRLAASGLAERDGDAFDLLRLCSFLGPDSISTDLLSDPAGRAELPDNLRAAARSDTRLRQLITRIVSAGLADEADGNLVLHRQVQAYFRGNMPAAELDYWNRTALSLMLAVFPADTADPYHWPLCVNLLDHTLVVGQRWRSADSAAAEVAVLLSRCGSYLFHRGAYGSSAAVFRRVAAIIRVSGGSATNYTTALSNLGLCRLNEGHLVRGERLLRRVLEVRKNTPGATTELAAAFNNLGCALRELGDLLGAEELFEPAIQARKEWEHDQKGYAIALNNLGVVRSQLRKPDAIQLLERALAQERELPGRSAIEVAVTVNNLSIAHTMQGAYSDAERILREALTGINRNLADDHPTTANLLENLGLALRGQGRAEEALIYLERALEIERRFFGEMHPEVVQTLSNLGVTQRHLGRYVSALLSQERALAIAEVVYEGGGQRPLASIHGALGNMLRRLGCLDESVEHHRKALEIELTVYGPGHFELAGTYDNLGRALRHLGQLDEARGCFEQALRIKRAHLDKDDPQIAKTLDNLGVVHRFIGDAQQAASFHEAALSIRRASASNPDSRQLHYSLTNYAAACRTLRRFAQAAEALEEAARLEEHG